MKIAPVQESINKKNLSLLILLRWLAVVGQVVTILVVEKWFLLDLPINDMGAVILCLSLVNIFGIYRIKMPSRVGDEELFIWILIDVLCLYTQIYLSGGVKNPFISLFILQVVLGAMVLRPVLAWILACIAMASFWCLTTVHRALDLNAVGDFYILGVAVCFVLTVVLLVTFMTRINRNLADREQRLLTLRQQTLEEEHILRMGLLAAGAAHELSTPLATLSVILNDWTHIPDMVVDEDVAADMSEMQTALARCKQIVSRILLAAGEARSDEFEKTTLVRFIDDVVRVWRHNSAPEHLEYVNQIEHDEPIASDAVIRQVLLNVFDNALEASPHWVGIEAFRRDDFFVLVVRDKGPGFAPVILENFGKPYQSTKGQPDRGLGLFLVVNVFRKLGGSVVPRNIGGGAQVELCLPISKLSIAPAAGGPRG